MKKVYVFITKSFYVFFTIFLLCSATGSLQAQDASYKLSNPTLVTVCSEAESNMLLAQRFQRAETWQPHVEELYKKGNLYKNIAYSIMAINATTYAIMHKRISWGEHSTDNAKGAFNTLNLLFGAVSGISLYCYIHGNNLHHEANQIINNRIWSLQINGDGIGFAYNF